jgi:hypothetical protein
MKNDKKKIESISEVTGKDLVKLVKSKGKIKNKIKSK